MCQAFAQQGYTPTLFAFQSPIVGNPTEDFFHHYGIQEQFDIDLIRSRKLLRGHDFALQVANRVKRQQFPFVYSRGLLGAMWTAIIGIPTIYETHQPPGSRLGQYYLRILLGRKSFRKLVVISDGLKTRYLERYPSLLSPEQIIVEPDAVDLERFEDLPDRRSAREKINLPEAVFTVGYAGHLYKGRGIDLILELAVQLREVNFVLIGGEEQHIQRWQMIVDDRRLENVRLVGFVANAELPKYLAACDILLMPYQQNIEVQGSKLSTHEWMSPMKMFEYMAAERLIISSDFPILRQVLNEKNAVLCSPKAIDEWETAIRRAIGQPEWGQKLATQARQDVEQYTWRTRVQRIMAEIE
jgi:glycosyltransferase involved in cell wall biosynthesis